MRKSVIVFTSRLATAAVVGGAVVLGCAIAQSSPSQASPVQDRAALVNPLIGTANGGNVFPGATMPFGMVQFSPEATPVNTRRMIAAPGGYEFRANALRGFSLTNVEGWGCAGGSGDVPLMPVTETIVASPSTDFRHTYASGFRHEDEKAEPGSYRVKLANGVQVSLAAGTRMGAATFAFPAGEPARVLVRTSDSEAGSTEAASQIDSATGTVTGSVTSGNFCGYLGTEDRRPYYTLYFVLRFDQPVVETGSWVDGALHPGQTSASGGTGLGPKGIPEAGHGSGVWLGFARGAEVRVSVGISYVSVSNARENLRMESAGGTRYEQVAARAREAWNRRLNQIEIRGGSQTQQRVFTTALYHALMTPTTYSDSNGEYRGMDRALHRVERGQTV